MQDDSLTDALAAALAPVLGQVQVSALVRLTGGASRETWSFDATDEVGTVHELVLRRDPPTRPADPGAMGTEARVMRVAATAGLPVPAILLDTDGSDLWGAAGMVMRRIPGETLARRILRDERFEVARRGLAAQCATAMAALHRVDPDTVEGLESTEPVHAMRTVLDRLGEPVPTFEFTLRWLEEHRPPRTDRAIVHGDFRLGNLMVDESGLRAVLDWELVHVGDPVEDLGWLCVRAWRFGAPLPVGGFGTREQLLDAYAAAGGEHIALTTLHWWEVYNTLRWGVICLTQASVHLRGDLRSVELAAIGRRVCETEWDLLALLAPDAAASALARSGDVDPAAGDPAGTEPAASESGLHGRPSSRELVASVREFLREQVMPGTEGSLSYHARVAANVLATVERELLVGPRQELARTSALAAFGVGSERELAAAVRADTVPSDGLVDLLADGVVARVAVANPRYLTLPA